MGGGELETIDDRWKSWYRGHSLGLGVCGGKLLKFRGMATYRQTQYMTWLATGPGGGGNVPGELACELHAEEDRCGLCGVHWIHREGAMP